MKLPLYIVLSISFLLLSVCRGESGTRDYSNINSGTLVLSNKNTVSDAIVLNSKVKMHISGPIADVVFVQHFKNSSKTWVEGTYVFPLPENASVRSMKIRIGERSIKGAIHERKIATNKYNAAKKNGKLANIINLQRSNLFTE